MITDPIYDSWLLPLDALAARYAEASEAFEVFKRDAAHSDVGDDKAEAAATAVSAECEAIRAEMVEHLAGVRNDDIVAAYEQTDGTGPRAEALLTEIRRRELDA
jgi:hypothetical protein